MENRYVRIGIVGLVTLLCGWASLRFPFGPDQGVFAQVGRTILEGGLPIRDSFDVKPPGVYLAYALAESVFGPYAWSIRLLDLVAVFLTSVCLLFVFDRFDRRAGLFAGALYPLVYFGCFSYAYTAQTEGFSNLFLSASFALLLCTKREGGLGIVLAGASVGVAVLTKTTNVLFLVPLVLLLVRETSHSPWRFMLGFALPWALMLGWFFMQGSPGTVVEMYVFQSEYGSRSFSTVGDFARVFWNRQVLHFSGLTFILLVGCVMAAVRWRSRELPDRVSRTWFLWALAIALLQMRFYSYHFVIVLPALCCVIASSFAASHLRKKNRMLVLAAPILALVMLVLNRQDVLQTVRLATGRIGPMEYGETVRHPQWYSVRDTEAVVAWLRENGHSGKSAYIDGFDPAIYWLAGLRPVSRHISTAPIYGEIQIEARLRFEWMREVKRDIVRGSPSVYIRHPRPNDQMGDAFELGFASGHYEVYVRSRSPDDERA
ncbi:MAG: glycosyltransferase family 39 protein, partial [Armatimonadetes bacterium]|nr:glycosyltransferase family 39 protein [Armatimonadota bacterium]